VGSRWKDSRQSGVESQTQEYVDRSVASGLAPAVKDVCIVIPAQAGIQHDGGSMLLVVVRSSVVRRNKHNPRINS